MKRIVMFLMLAVIGLSASAQIQYGRSSVGLNLGYGFDSKNPIIGIDYRYAMTNALRVNPAISHYIKNDGLSAWAIDLNLHYLVPLSETVSFYPLAGVDLSFWNQRYLDKEPRSKDSEATTRFGANVGLGLEYYGPNRLTYGLEVKYQIISKVDQAIISARVGYRF